MKRLSQWLIGALVLVGPVTVRAQPLVEPQGGDDEAPPEVAPPQAKPPQAAPSQVTPPEPLRVPTTPYPENGVGDHEVKLLIVIGEDGRVRGVEIAEGREPFASAARRATAGWRFRPAMRDGEPMVAKIAYVVSFEQTEVVSPPEPSGSDLSGVDASAEDGSADGPADGDGPNFGALDVLVEGERAPPPSVSTMDRAEVRQLPGAFGDPFRAIEVLPGVTPIVSGLPFFYLRGAPPGNIGYYLDGIRVPYLFHVAAGPSVVNPALVDRVDLYSGGYPARLGRFAGGIVSAETTEPNPEWHGEGVIRLVDAGAFVEGGFDEGRGTVAVGGRYSYTAAVLSLLAPTVTLDYRDYQARVTYDFTPRDRITMFTFGSYDYLSNTTEEDGEEIETVLFGQEFYRVDTRYDHRLPGGGSLRAALTMGFDQTSLVAARNSQNLILGARVRLSQPLEKNLILRGGFDMQVDNFTADARQYVDPEDPFRERFDSLFPPRSDTGAAYWTDLVWQVTPDFEITPGLRLDTYSSEGAQAAAFDPRLAVVASVHDDVRILHAVGMANQPPSFTVPVPGLAVPSLEGGLQRSLQASSGVEVELPYEITATLTGYGAAFFDMTDAVGSQIDPIDPTIPRSLGSSYGLEIYVRRSLTKRFGGFVSYTLSRTTRTVDGETRLSTFDRTHVLNTAFGYDLGSGWKAGARFSLFSGTPTAPVPEDAPDGTQVRDPPFYRIDFRAEKRWDILDGDAWIALVAEMINITLAREIVAGNELPPVSVPSIGVEGGF